MTIKNKGKNPNKLHDYLIDNNCKPSYLGHDAKYNDYGEKIKEATEIYVEIAAEKEQELMDLVSQFMTD